MNRHASPVRPPRSAPSLATARPARTPATKAPAAIAAAASLAAIVLLTGPLSAHAAPAGPIEDYTFVRPNGTGEWTAAGDFNGDGRLDVVIVDRATGAYRLGYGAAAGAEPSWPAARASGIDDVSGLAIGQLFDANTHGLAFCGAAANRVNVVRADNPSTAGVPVPIFLPAVGPHAVAALEVGGAGNTPLHDLLAASGWNGAAPHRTTTVRNPDGAAFTTLQDLPSAEPWERLNRVTLRTGLPSVLAVMARGATDTLRLVSYAGGPAETVVQFSGLPAGADYAFGRFASGHGLAQALVHRPGQSTGTVHRLTEPVPGTFQAAAPVGFSLPGAIEVLVPLPADTGVPARLLAILDGGARAQLCAFDGTNAPSPIQELLPPEGRRFRGAVPSERGGVRIAVGDVDGAASSTSPGSTSSSMQEYTRDAATGALQLARTQALPRVTPYSARANVLQFQFEPFVHPRPRLLSSLHAGDWSSLFSLAGAPAQVGVTAESYIDAAQGLSQPSVVSLGTSHPQTQFGLANQYAEAVSLFRLSPASGPQVTEITVTPPGGFHARAVAVTFSTGTPGFQVLYRLNAAGPWLTYAGTGIPIFTNATLQFRARNLLSGIQTSIRSESYSFPAGPSTLDSDGDGVPDYVEIANGLDPVRSGGDADGDGFSDLEELLKNTSPSNPASHPAQSGYEQHAAVDWMLTPRPIDGFTGTDTTMAGGPQVRVFDGSGALVAVATEDGAPAGSRLAPGVLLDPRHPFLLAATDPHYDILTPSPDRRLGRELVALLSKPAVEPIRVHYAFGTAGGDIAAEAVKWVNAAKAAYLGATNPLVSRPMTIVDTTIALLVEERLRTVLSTLDPAWTDLTLFPFRPADAGRPAFTEAARALLTPPKPGQPAYDPARWLATAETLARKSPTGPVQALHAVAHEIHRVSSASNNAAPGRYRLPVDALRQFIRNGTIHSNHLADGIFPPALLANATVGVKSILESLGSRPVTNLTLRLPATPDANSTDAACTTLETTDVVPSPIRLLAPGGGPFDLPDTFQLVPGTVLRVTGHPDVASSTCPGPAIEVLSVTIEAIPSRSDGDADGNLLPDAWERQFLGGLGGDPFADGDGDGYSNLQELLEGSDPADRLGRPSAPPAPLQLPALALQPTVGGQLALEWFWPDAYRHRVEFQILATPDLAIAPTPVPTAPIAQGGGVQRVVLPNTGETRFFQVRLQLKL